MEELIGIWINEKPLYSQTFTTTTVGGWGGGNYGSVDIDISSINFEDIAKMTSKIVSPTLYSPDGNSYHTGQAFSCYTYMTMDSSNKPVIRCKNNQSWGAGYTAYVTLYYTKTTD